jgi:glutamine synthetase
LTDIKRLATPERQAKKLEVLRLIKKENVEYVYCQHISITGRIVGKGVPANHFGEIVDNGYQLVYGSVADLFMDRYDNYIGFGANESELIGMPDLDTFKILPWDRRIARVYCDCYDSETGDLFDADCRSNLKRVVAEVEKEIGRNFLCGIEPEMMWLKEDANGKVAGVTQPWCYHIAQFETLRPVFMDVITYGKALGLDMIQGDHEDAPGQLELNIHHDRALATADNISTYRQVCNEVARKHGLIACFMPKPFVGVSANGHHHHFSMEDKAGKSLFFDPKGPGKMSEPGRWFLGGILKHADALCALTASTVNSYKRFMDAGFWAPLYKDWGWQNRTSIVRVAAAGRFEFRVCATRSIRDRLSSTTSTTSSAAKSTWAPKEGGSESRSTWARHSRPWRRTTSSARCCPAACTTCSCTTRRTNGSATWPTSPTGSSNATCISCRE